MKNHACRFANYCGDYGADKCQGCGRVATSGQARITTKMLERAFNNIAGVCVDRPPLRIRKVIFNEPATVVYWGDGSKTVVKCQKGDTYSKETGLAVAIAKKALGNNGNFNEVFKKWIPEY